MLSMSGMYLLSQTHQVFNVHAQLADEALGVPKSLEFLNYGNPFNAANSSATK
jgi:hypothetical protein